MLVKLNPNNVFKAYVKIKITINNISENIIEYAKLKEFSQTLFLFIITGIILNAIKEIDNPNET